MENTMLKRLRKLWFKLFVEGTTGYYLGMYRRQYDAEIKAMEEGREFTRVPFEQLENWRT